MRRLYRRSLEIHNGEVREVRKLTVLNCGGGRQSAQLALAAAKGEHQVDVVIMADTGNERKATLRYWEQVIVPALDDAGIPHFVVQAGEYRAQRGKHAGQLRRSGEGIASDLLRSARAQTPIANPPLWASKRGPGLQGSPLKRLCTSEYKIAPITAKIREILGLRPGQRGITKAVRCEVVQLIGIATEEASRAKGTVETAEWITLRYPLLEQGLSTADCVAWFLAHGYPVPVKSACLICPYRSDASWAKLRRDDPAGFDQAVAIDRELREGGRRIKGAEHQVFVHPSCRPLGEIDFSQADLDAPEAFGGEC